MVHLLATDSMHGVLVIMGYFSMGKKSDDESRSYDGHLYSLGPFICMGILYNTLGFFRGVGGGKGGISPPPPPPHPEMDHDQ